MNPNARFAEVWQFDKEWPGSVLQRNAIIDSWYLEFDSDRHRAMKRLDKSTNEIYKRSYLVIGFPPDDMFDPNRSAIAGVTGINFRASYNVGVLGNQADHELFHVYDKHLMTAKLRLDFMLMEGIDPNLNEWNRNVQETFADAGRDWWHGKRPDLTPILLPTVESVLPFD